MSKITQPRCYLRNNITNIDKAPLIQKFQQPNLLHSKNLFTYTFVKKSKISKNYWHLNWKTGANICSLSVKVVIYRSKKVYFKRSTKYFF